MRNKIVATFLLLLLASVSIFGQNLKNNSEPNGLALEINFDEKKEPMQINVPNSQIPKGAWFSSFLRKSLKSKRIRAINIVSRLNEDKVEIRVSLIKGKRFHDKEETIANYSLEEGEKVLVSKLKNFGIEPIHISVVRIIPSVSPLPTVDNKTNSLQVIEIAPNYSTLPTFKFKVINNSVKAVKSFSFQTKLGDKRLFSSMSRNLLARNLIEPSKTFERIFPNSYKKIRNIESQSLEIQPEQKLEISAVVFEDGSFEGDETDAARMLGMYLGRKIQLERTIAIFSKLLKSTDSAKIENDISNINSKIENKDIQSLVDKFPNVSKRRIKIAVEVATNSHKRNLIKEFNSVRKGAKDSDQIISWLQATINKYENWLRRIPL